MTARLHRLPNGVTVAVEPMAGVETLAVGLYADVGAAAEPDDRAGLAHMVEHMVFKGAGTRDARQLAEAIEDVGGAINAWTSRDHTVFHARLLGPDLALGVEVIADMVRAPRFDGDELEREKQVVLSELGEARDTPDDIVFDHLQAAAFPGQPLGRPVLGTEDTIPAIAAADLRGWVDGQYSPGRLILAAAGKVDEDALLALADARFGDLAPGPAEPVPPAATWAGGTHHDTRRFDQLHLTLAHQGVGQADAALPALALWTHAAGGGMSSRLFQEVREARGLAYSVYAWSHAHRDTGLFGVYLACARADAARALALTRDTLAACADGLTQAELDRARAQLRAGLLMGLEGVQGRCDHLARQVQVHGRAVPVAETLVEMDAVTLDDARAAARAALATPEALATVGGKLARAA